MLNTTIDYEPVYVWCIITTYIMKEVDRIQFYQNLKALRQRTVYDILITHFNYKFKKVYCHVLSDYRRDLDW
jgi:hypothetical protein